MLLPLRHPSEAFEILVPRHIKKLDRFLQKGNLPFKNKIDSVYLIQNMYLLQSFKGKISHPDLTDPSHLFLCIPFFLAQMVVCPQHH